MMLWKNACRLCERILLNLLLLLENLTPAQFQVLTNSSETTIVPYIPVDKISINIHYTNKHWLTSVYCARANVINVLTL